MVVYVYVEDVEKTVGRAVAAGARILRPIDNQLWGDQIAWIIDPEGHVWVIATRIEDAISRNRETVVRDVEKTIKQGLNQPLRRAPHSYLPHLFVQ